MRFLLTCIPGLGHFNPLLPLARSLRDAGHDVAIATAPAFADVVRGAGFEFIAAGLDWDERRLLDTLPELRAVAKMNRGEWMMKRIFLHRSPRRMIADLRTILPEWQPDMIVSGSFEYGGPLAAEKAGLAYATANYTVRWNRWVRKLALGRPIARLRAEIGLPPDADMNAFERYLDLCFAPPSWTFERALLRPGLKRLVRAKVLSADLPGRQRLSGVRALLLQRIFLRQMVSRPEQGAIGAKTHFIGEGKPSARSAPPPWLRDLPYNRTAFFSLGTVLGGEHPDMFDKVLAAFKDQPVNLIMTLGANGDPSRFVPQPANVRIFTYLDHGELRALLPHVDLCINHAGYGSVMDALLYGIPLVLLPLTSDGPMNTQMCLSTGVAPELPSPVWGISPKGLPVVRPEKLTPSILRQAVNQALEDPTYRAAARRMQSELAARPGPQEGVALLERVIRGQGSIS
jgi:UDP:flavonoid glycosyltransferase YjiC (YdhE family)